MSDTPVRTLIDHIVNPCNEKLTITVTDAPGADGANHSYVVHGGDFGSNPSLKTMHVANVDEAIGILFQNGPINEFGVNGITNEALLAIIADRLRSFQKGPHSCKANACALTHIEEAQNWLQRRTIERMRRGVEGTHMV